MSRVALIFLAASLLCRAQKPPVSDLEAANQLTSLMADAHAAETRHDDATAASKYEAVLELVKQHPALGSGLEEVALNGLSKVEVRLGHFERAAQLVERRVAIIRKQSNREMDATVSLAELIGIYARLHRLPDAKRCFDEASRILDGCLFYPANVKQKTDCATTKWALFATWGGMLYSQNQDVDAEPIIRAVIDAPEGEVPPQFRFVALRLEAALLTRSGKDKEGLEMSQRAADYERQHPDAAAKASATFVAPALQQQPLLRQALLKLNQMDQQLLAGTLMPDDDLSTLGPYADAVKLVRDNLYKQQQEILQTRAELRGLKLADVLAPETLATSEGRAASHEKLRKAKVLEARLAVVSQESVSSTQEALRQKAQGPYTPEEREAFNAILSQIVNSTGYVYERASQIETASIQLLEKEDEFITDLDRRAGHFSLQNGKLVFEAAEDEAAYKAGMDQFKTFAARIIALQQQLINDIRKHDADANQTLRQP